MTHSGVSFCVDASTRHCDIFAYKERYRFSKSFFLAHPSQTARDGPRSRRRVTAACTDNGREWKGDIPFMNKNIVKLASLCKNAVLQNVHEERSQCCRGINYQTLIIVKIYFFALSFDRVLSKIIS